MKKKLKNRIAAVVLVLLLLQLTPFAAAAADSGQCGVGVFWKRTGDVLEICGSGMIADYDWPAAPEWAPFAGEIRTLKIGEGIRRIGNHAFGQFSALEHISLPSTLESIGTSAFADCRGLGTISLPARLSDLSVSAFQGCSALSRITVESGNAAYRSVDGVLFSGDGRKLIRYPSASARAAYTVPDGVEYVAQEAFYGSNLQSVVLPDSVREIGTQAFMDSPALKKVAFSARLRKIGNSAFEKCSALQKVDMSVCDEVAIGEFAFSCCTSLNVVLLPEKVTAVEQQAFEGTPYLEAARALSPEAVYLGTVLYEVDASAAGTFSVRAGTKLLASYAFFGCDQLSSVSLPESVEVIGRRCFYGCRSLVQLRCPRHAVSIGREALTDVPEALLEEDNGVLYLGNHAIRMSGSSASALRTGTTDIAAFGLAWNTSPTIALPDTLQIISECAFLGAAAEEILLPQAVREIGPDAFSHAGIRTCVVPDGVSAIPDQCFLRSALCEIVLPPVMEIRANAFAGCALSDVHYAGSDRSAIFIEHGNDALLAAPHEHFRCTAANSWTTKIQQPTRQAGGLTLHTCTCCGYTYVDNETPALPQPFTDVPEDAYYADAVSWAVECGVTDGTSATTFSPDATCTRGQVVTFLWRAKGCPEPKRTANPFADVESDAYYFKAVLWAVEQGITNGMSARSFSPESPCTRAHVVTFLWRAEGGAKSGNGNPFTDVPDEQYYTSAVLWAVNHDPQITNGTSATTFSPENDCTRGQIVTFIFRAKA